MFYAPWCGHCTKMKPDFSKAAQIVADGKYGILAAVDSTKNPESQEKYKIDGFPKLKYFENGVFKRDYKGARTTDDLVAFVKSSGLVKDEF